MISVFELGTLGCRVTQRPIFEFVNTAFIGSYWDNEQEEKRYRAYNDVF